MPNFLTLRQVAEQLGVSERTVYRLMEEEELHPFKMGKAWKFEQPDIDAYIDRLRQQSEIIRRGRPRGSTERTSDASGDEHRGTALARAI